MIVRIFTFIFLAFLFLITPFSAFAQTPSPSPNLQIPTSVSPTSPIYTDLLIHNMFHTFSCLTSGSSVIGQPCLTYQITKTAQGAVQSIPVLSETNLSGGALGATTSLIGALYANPPVRTADYLASVGEGLGIVKEANAQVGGSGANVLKPILSLWQVSRNIAYLIMTIIFIVIGMMVMFRNKINPQTVITAQAALPGLVIGLIMITFSYFLAGIIADTAFIGTNLVGAYFSAVKGPPPPGQPQPQGGLTEQLKGESVIKTFGAYTGIIDQGVASSSLYSVWEGLPAWPKTILTLLAVFLTAQTTQQTTEFLTAIPNFFGQGLQSAIVAITSAATFANPTGMVGWGIAFIATIVLLYSMFKLLLRLVNSYLAIILLTITAPFQFLFSALPGRQGMATGWVMNLLGNALAFPAVIAVFYFVAFILGPSNPPSSVFKANSINGVNNEGLVSEAQAQGTTQDGFKIVDKETFPLFGGLNLDFVKILLAFGALVALPAIPDVIQKSIGAVSQAGQLLGQEIGGDVGQGNRYYGQFQSGVGQASGSLAKARGLFDTEQYYVKEFKEGKPVYGVNPYSSHIGTLRKQGVKAAYKAQMKQGPG